MDHEIIELCKKAADINYSAKYRKGNILELAGRGRLIVTGDLHGHARNFQKILTYADLEKNPDTHLVLQEILHGGDKDDFGGCLSFQVFFQILKLQVKYPNRVHLIMGNHDTAIITDKEVTKGGKEMNQALKDALKRCFADDCQEIHEAIKEYLLSQPLAIKTAGKTWISHSLPADQYVTDFDIDLFETELFPDDLERPKPAYQLTWGRRHSNEKLQEMADILGVENIILGHQRQETGFKKAGDNLIIITSEHNHGCLLAFDMDKPYTIDRLMECIVPLASVPVNQS